MIKWADRFRLEMYLNDREPAFDFSMSLAGTEPLSLLFSKFLPSKEKIKYTRASQ